MGDANVEYESLFTGFPLRHLVSFLKENILALLKLIVLERKVIIYSHRPSVVSGFILSVCALIPGLLGFGGERLNSRKVSACLVRFVGVLTSGGRKPRKCMASRCTCTTTRRF